MLCHNDEEEEVGILSYTRDILGYTNVYCVICVCVSVCVHVCLCVCHAPTITPNLTSMTLRCSAESLFINHALTPSGLVEANDIAILYDLDVHELYKIVAEKKLEEGHYQEALEVYLHSMVSG